MTPTLVHRYTWPIHEAIEHLLGDAAGDCESWRIRVEGDELVIYVVAPAYAGRTIEVPDNFDVDKLCDMIVAGEFKMPPENDQAAPAERTVIAETPSIETPVTAPEATAKPERKGGKLAQVAGIICAERGFWKFLAERDGAEIRSADEAAGWIRVKFGIASRADLDHEPLKAEAFREVEKSYRLWLDGY
jgi:hypothetical protein